MQFRRTLAAQPNNHAGRINPKERRNFACHFHGFVTLQALQGLNEKHSVVGFAVSALVPMNAFPLKKELSFQWRPTLPPRRTARAI